MPSLLVLNLQVLLSSCLEEFKAIIMATKFADLAKPVTSLLNDDYVSKVGLKAKTDAGPVNVTIETDAGKDGSLTSKISSKFSYASFNVDKLQTAADGSRTLETSLKLSPEIKFSFKASKGADLGVDYVKGNLYATGTLDVMDMSKLSSSACLVLASGIKVGGDATYSLTGAGLTNFGVGGSFTTNNGRCFGAVTATSKLSKYNLSLLYKVSPELSIASSTTHSSSKACEVMAIGGSYKAEGLGTIKAKMASNQVFHACLIREVAPKVTVTACGSVTGSDMSTFKPGFYVSI